MKLLLDTHVLLWTLLDDDRLSLRARRLIENEENDIYYSIASIWEIEMKHLTHPDKMTFSAVEILSYCRKSGFFRMQIGEEHILYLKKLERPQNAPPHKDPFDRIMICQAAAENMLFLTHDSLLPDYKEPYIYSV